jgi:hypothetical protein
LTGDPFFGDSILRGEKDIELLLLVWCKDVVLLVTGVKLSATHVPFSHHMCSCCERGHFLVGEITIRLVPPRIEKVGGISIGDSSAGGGHPYRQPATLY